MNTDWLQLAIERLSATRVADVLDIVVVTVFIYSAVSSLRRARSRFVIYGTVLVSGLYLVARLLEMEVTLTLFRLGVAVAALSLVVIFQEEIRRAFERLSSGRVLVRSRTRPEWRELVGTVVESATTLAEGSVGALLVFKGREPLERHLNGGHRLDGMISIPLLESIFDASTPGHDGAVVIEGGRAASFGAHLPLSKSRSVDHMGTRHTAAVGLTERSDALVVVVSEERSQISVARYGDLEAVSPVQLEESLESFFLDLYPPRRIGHLRRALTRDVGVKLLSLTAAVVLWVGLTGVQGQPMTRSFDVPIAYRDPPPGLILDPPSPGQARIVLSGTRGSFDRLDSSRLLIAIDASNEQAGRRRVQLSPEQVERPAGMVVDGIEPSFTNIMAHEAIQHELEVVPQTTGRVPSRVVLRSTTCTPAKVPVSIRRADRRRLGPARTAPIVLDQLTSTSTLTVPLVLPPGAHRVPGTPETVRVTVEIETQRHERE